MVLVITPPYFGVPGDANFCGAGASGFAVAVETGEVVGEAGVVGAAISSGAHDAITRDSAIRQQTSNHIIFFTIFLLSSSDLILHDSSEYSSIELYR